MRKPREDKHVEGDRQGTEDERGSGHDERKEGRREVRRPSREKVYQRMPEPFTHSSMNEIALMSMAR